MSANATSAPARWTFSRLATWISGSLSSLLLLAILFSVGSQVLGNLTPLPLTLVRDVSLPSALPAHFLQDLKHIPSHEDPLAPGVSIPLDHFDFQALDTIKGLLFIAHTGPNADKISGLISKNFNSTKNLSSDGHILVFDTHTNKLIGRVNVPQITGIVLDPDNSTVYASDPREDMIIAINEITLHTTAIPVDRFETPDAIAYDADDHKIFVSDPGAAINPSPDINPDHQNLSVIDLDHANHVSKINLGHLQTLPGEQKNLSQFGYNVGHNKYDHDLHRIFVPIHQLMSQAGVNPSAPPAGTSELVAIDPVNQQVTSRVPLPKSCGLPHGFNIDQQAQIGYIACTAIDSIQHLVPNIVRVDLRTMQVISDPLLPLSAKPDIVVMDSAAHTLFVGSAGAISIFSLSGRSIKYRGNFFVGKATHTLVIDEGSQLLYLPLVDAGGRPVLRIERFNPTAFP